MGTKEKLILAVISIVLFFISKRTNNLKQMSTKEKLTLAAISLTLLVVACAIVGMWLTGN